MENKNPLETVMVVASQFSKERDYWLNKLSGDLVKIGFPYTDNVRTGCKQPAGAGRETVTFSLPQSHFARLMKISSGSDARLHIILVAAIILLLDKYTYHHIKDVIVGVPIYKQKVVGILVNTVLALRNHLDQTMTFKELILQVHQLLKEAVENQNYPVEALLYHLGMPSHQGEFPLFDLAVLLENIHNKKYLEHIKLNMIFSFCRSSETINGLVEYNPSKYQKKDIERISSHLLQLLQNAIFNLDTKIFHVEILSPEEKNQILYHFNHNKDKAGFPVNKTLHELLAGQVERIPDNIAVIVSGAGGAPVDCPQHCEQHLSYRELNEKSLQLAYLLRQKGVQPDTIVTLMLQPSIEMIIGILGILKAGGAYMPIDQDYPRDRIDFMLKDSNAGVLVTTPKLQVKAKAEVEEGSGQPQGLPLQTINIEKNIFYISKNAPSTLTSTSTLREVGPANLAYVIYTSGTTGKPKGSLIDHRSVVSLMFHDNYLFDFSSNDVWTMFHSYCFDFSVWEMYGALLYGGKLVLIPQMTARDIQQFLQILKEENVTILNQTPDAFYNLADRELESWEKKLNLRYVIFGGEALKPAKLKRWQKKYPETKMINMFGITETTVHVTYKELDERDIRLNTNKIGQPISTLSTYVMDKRLKLVPGGVAGELCVGGQGVCRGYLNRPELTAEKFIENPYKPGERLYRSGDLTQFAENGEIKYLGRIDHQVKIRGYRIELAEIEHQLLKHHEIREAIVLALAESKNPGKAPLDPEDKYLCAYFVSGRELTVSALREYLSKMLPDFMIPSYFMQVEKIPLTPNGKIDRKALPVPEAVSGSMYLAPRDEIEEKMVEIWSGVLGTSAPIGIDDNFFELGGHSLRATVMAVKIHKEFNVKLPLAEIFTTPTLRGLGEYIKAAARVRYSSIEPVEKRDYYALSSAQKRLYILQQMELESTAYNMPIVIQLEEETSIEKLETTFKKLINRHESLRTSFHMIREEPVQKIHQKVDFEIEYYETEIDHSSISEIMNHSFVRSFDLSQTPLLRAGLIKTAGKRYLLLIDMHHITSDGVSQQILEKNFLALFKDEQSTPLRLQYKDFSQWQNSQYEKESQKRQESYWLKELDGEIPILDLPLDFARPAVQHFEGDVVGFEISADETRALKKLSLETGSTLFMVLLAVNNVLLAKLSNQEDIVIGSPVAGRRHTDLEKIIGIFINTLALRNYPGGDKPFIEFLNQVKERTLEAFENQEYPFEELVEQVEVNRDISRNPLFDVLFVLHNIAVNSPGQSTEDTFNAEKPGIAIETPALKLQPDAYNSRIAKFDMSLYGIESGESLYFTFEYCTKLFKKETIERFIIYYKNVISSIVREPELNLGEIDIISEEEKSQLLHDFNDTETGYPRDKTLQQLFEEQVEKNPNHIAIAGMAHGVPGGSLENAGYITYRELNKKSNQLAGLLLEKGVQPDTIVPVLLDRSIEMMIGILGILKSGSAYLPIDPIYPAERIKFMLLDSNAKVLVTTSTLAKQVETLTGWEPKRNLQRVLLNFLGFPSSLPSSPPVFPTSRPSNMVYVIYTSGSTGKPKGVVIQHRSLINFIKGITDIIYFNKNDAILSLTTSCFDIFGLETLLPLTKDCKVVIGTAEDQCNSDAAAKVMMKEGITILQVTPSRLLMLIEDEAAVKGIKCLKYLLVGGEAFPQQLLDNARKVTSARIYNLYGPTETTIWSTAKDVTVGNTLNIGTPIANTRVYILNKYHKLQPVGIAGELCIGGDGLSRGYLNNSGLTAEKFRRWHPQLIKTLKRDTNDKYLMTNDRFYRTGDNVRWLPDGSIELLGRLDHQVKIRGYRIELGEIESQLLKYPGVKEVVVVVGGDQDDGGNQYLCAYIVGKSGREFSTGLSELSRYLSQSLPDYMVPTYMMEVEAIPLTFSGKVDRKALPVPLLKGADRYTAPRDKIELKMTTIWGQLLHIKPGTPIGIDDDFFALGGNSLKAIVLISLIHKAFNVRVPLAEIFKTPRIRSLSGYITGKSPDKYVSIKAAEAKEYYPLSPAQKRLFFIQRMLAHSTAYNLPQLFLIEGKIHRGRWEKIFRKLIKRHESLRTSYHMILLEPAQKIHHHVEFEIEWYQDKDKVEKAGQMVEGTDEGDSHRPWHEDIIKDFIRPFDLSDAPLLRVGLVQLAKEKHILVVDIHHIVSDGVSNGTLIYDFFSLYRGDEPPFLPLQYRDYIEWQNNNSQKETLKKQETYWLKQFSGEIPALNLLPDYPRPDRERFEAEDINFQLGKELTRQLNRMARETGATLYMILLAVYNILLSKYTGQEDIVVGTGTAGRRHADLQNIVGLFVNLLALRNRPGKEKSFKEFLEEVKVNTLYAFENQDYPFDELVKKLNLERDWTRNPLFDTLFIMQNIDRHLPGVGLDDLKAAPYQFEKSVSPLDLSIQAFEINDTIGMRLYYLISLFKRSTAEYISKHFIEIIQQVAKNKEISLKDITISQVLATARSVVKKEEFLDFGF